MICHVCLLVAFNLDPRLPVIKRGESGSYFGYSVAEHQVLDRQNSVLKHVLLVGSPRASTGQPGTNHSGAVYRCGVNTLTDDCEQLDIEYSDEPPESDEIKDDQWLGVTVKSQGPGGYVLACAHRYIKKGPDYQWGFGICYSLTQELHGHRAWEPCMNRPVSKAHEQFGYCQAGTSGDLSKDHELVIGSPGPYTWRGTVFVNSVKFGLKDDKMWYFGPLLDDNAPVEKYSYLGMAATSGKFFGNETTFVGGAPRGNGTGQVVFFKKQKGHSTLLVELVLSGEQFASYYGFSLASLDINNDGYIDLVVGSPFYYSRGEGGAVYVYMNSESGISDENISLKLTGKPESQFGFSLTSLGDLNRDGYPDLAVGAPYEGNGAIYIYLGSSDGLVPEPSQVIRTENLPRVARRDLASFGYSLSGGMDLDNNGYPDLLVGAYDSDTVILIRSRPIIDIITSVEGNLTQIDPHGVGCEEDRNATLVCFSFEACFHFNSSELSHRTYIRLGYKIEAETFTGKKYYRVRFRLPAKSETPNVVEKELPVRGVSLFEPHCSKELVYLKEKTDIQTPIKFKLTYTLIQEEPPRVVKEGDPLPNINRYPILNQQEASRLFEAKFLKNCGSDDICQSDLHVVAELNLPKEESGIPALFLGEQYVNLSIVLHNYKEPAYDSHLYVTHPSTLSYIRSKVVKGEPVECVPFNSTLVKCDVGNPMNKGEIEFQIRFSPRNVTDDEKRLKFVLKANTTSEETDPEDDVVLIADVVRSAELELTGVSDPEQVFYGEDGLKVKEIKTGADIGSLVIHTYEVVNYGPWKASEVQVLLLWPYQTETFQEHGKWLLYLMDTPEVIGNGFCEIETYMINPLHISVKREEEAAVTEVSSQPEKPREKRSAPEEVRLEGKDTHAVTIDCKGGKAKCYPFKCVIKDLQPDKNAVINIRSRLWSKTFLEDYPESGCVNVISHAQIYVDPELDIRQNSDRNDFAHATTRACSLYQRPEEVPLWIIILAICGGLLLLIILILCLWKLGFFKRKKPGYMPAATSEKEKEFNNI